MLTLDPGDSVRFQCLDALWGSGPYDVQARHQPRFPDRVPGLDDGHALTGPVAIRGARPGMTLAIHVNALEVGAWGTALAGGWPSAWNDRLGLSDVQGVIHAWTFDPQSGTATNQYGHTVRLRPFMGLFGMPADVPGSQSTTPPRRTGGNIDCKELGVGSTLYLPIEVEGGLFSVGDGHAAQGDGEISGTAIECPMERVDLTFALHDDLPLAAPIAETPVGWIAMGFHEDLNEALVCALEGMLALMKRLHGLERLDALALAGVVVDFRVTQAVNGVRGVHAVLPHNAIR